MDIDFNNLDLNSADSVLNLIQKVFSASPERLKHVLAVADKVKESAVIIRQKGYDLDVDEAYRAALLHDIGYSSSLKDTGFHPIDGANFLRKRGYHDLAEYIECHSNSAECARLQGLPEIKISNELIADLITYWDVRVKQGGQIVDYEQRLADIKARHGEDSLSWQAHLLAKGRIEKIIERISPMLTDNE